jgi:hypothetical protein
VPQPTAQYGHVERVSLARAIFRVRSCAKAGCKSKPNTAAAEPPMVVSFRKSRRDGFTENPLSARSKEGERSRTDIHKSLARTCQAVIWGWPRTSGNSCRAPACSSCLTCAVDDPRSTLIKGKVQLPRRSFFRRKRPMRSLMARRCPCGLWQLRHDIAQAEG